MMKKKIGIYTFNDNTNFGNRLQNYATQVLLEEYGTVENAMPKFRNCTEQLKYYLWCLMGHGLEKKFPSKSYRVYHFLKFDHNIEYSTTRNKMYDAYVYGSDQIWNPLFQKKDLINPHTPAKNNIAFAASIGIDSIPIEYDKLFRIGLDKFKAISVREDTAADIVEKYTGTRPVVLMDPTLCLSSNAWSKLETLPDCNFSKPYLLLYFLGEISSERKEKIRQFAEENNLNIINLLDEKLYDKLSPSDFIFLIHHARFVITDSFHGAVFSIIFKRHFLVFNREDGLSKMNSRIETLLNKFDFQWINLDKVKKIDSSMFIHDYEKVDVVINEEIKKTKSFLDTAFTD